MKASDSKAITAESNPHQNTEVSIGKRIAAEMVGTGGLTMASAGIEVLAYLFPRDFGVEIRAVGPALIIGSLIYSLGKISGAHFNPVVTLAFAVRGDFPWKLTPIYFFSECLGAVFGAYLLTLFFPDGLSAGVNRPYTLIKHASFVEIILTFFLIFTILSTATQHRILGPNAALPVTMAISGCGLLGLKISGPSMNPARSLGPALISGNLNLLWIYIAGPIIGALLAAVMFSLIRIKNEEEEEAACGEGN